MKPYSAPGMIAASTHRDPALGSGDVAVLVIPIDIGLALAITTVAPWVLVSADV